MSEDLKHSSPKLFNWVRAIRIISKISAFYTTLVIILAAALFVLSNPLETEKSFPLSLATILVSTLLLTLGARRIIIARLANRFKSALSFEAVLASWCILLILIHFECQLIAIILFNPSVHFMISIPAIILVAAVVYLTRPKLQSIQSLLQTK